MPGPSELIATCAFGLEAVVARELTGLGYESRVVRPGRLLFTGDAEAICRTNIHLRVAERILLCVGKIPASDFDELFEGVRRMPWEEWIPVDGDFPVRGRAQKSQLTSVPAVQRCVKKAIVERLASAHGSSLDETGPPYRVEVALFENEATLTIDTTGDGIHKRGYRELTGPAPLRETLAAALIQLSFWIPDRPFLDPFCGTGTLTIEAALIGRRIAPGLRRQFAAERWPQIPATMWQAVRRAATDLALPELPQRLVATDSDADVLKMARFHAQKAGVDDDIHWQQRDFADLTSKREFGCLICNPPYGRRLEEQRDVERLLATFPDVLRRLPTWSHFILSASSRFESILGQRADRRRKLYNGRIECQYYQFHGPKPPKLRREQPERSTDSTAPARPTSVVTAASRQSGRLMPVFGGLKGDAQRQATEFGDRLAKRARHLRRWPKRGITCYRLYERDIPEIPLVVDRYEDRLHIAEFERPHERTPAQHAEWLDHMANTAAEVLETPRRLVYLKRRIRQRDRLQYEKVDSTADKFVANENGLRFYVNLADYLDTGLFLDHRITRGMVREAVAGKRFLNLFGYTGSFTVYAAAGGARETVTVDLSKTYLDWASENLRLNGLLTEDHRFIRSDAITYLRNLDPVERFDVVVVDPPTYSNSKRTEEDWNIQRDYVTLLNQLAPHVTPQGVVYFSTNFRRFKFDSSALENLTAHEISKQTVPEDFRNRRIHRCWRLMRT